MKKFSIEEFILSKSFKNIFAIFLVFITCFIFIAPFNKVTYFYLIKSNKNISIQGEKGKLGDTVFVVQNTKDGSDWELISKSNFIPKDTSYVFYENNRQYNFTISKAVVMDKK